MTSEEENIQELIEEIDYSENKLQRIKEENRKIYEAIEEIDIKIQEATRKLGCLKKSYECEGFFGKRALRKNISTTERRILQLTEEKDALQRKLRQTETLREEIERKKECLRKLREECMTLGDPWPGYPGELEEEEMNRLNTEFRKLSIPSSAKVPYINVLLVGGVGSGKSSFINTCMTALQDSPTVINAAEVAPSDQGSVTKEFLPYALKMKTMENKLLPVRLFDCAGMSDDLEIQVMDMLFQGKIKPQTEITSVKEMSTKRGILRKDPKPEDKIHSFVLVIRADSNLEEKYGTLDQIKEILRNTHETCRHPYVLLTAIDRIAVPNWDIKQIYRYQKVKNICKKAADVLKVPLNRILPMSNYFEETCATEPKNILALTNLLFMCHSGLQYLQNNVTTGGIPSNFYD